MSADSKLAANADIYQEVFEAVEALGYTVKWSSGWATRSASHSEDKIVKPTCGITHHTASNNTSTSYIQNGDPGRGLTGPLANVHIPRDGVINVLGCGYQNHAGNNHKPCYDRMIDGTAPLDRDLVPGPDGDFSANRYALAIEVNGDGGSDDYTDAQYNAVLAIFTELHRVMGWKTARVGAHKELTTRKPDDPVRSMGTLRTDVLAALSLPPIPLPPVDVQFRFGAANLMAECFGGLDDDSPKRGEYLAEELAGSSYALSEVSETARYAIRDAMGGQDRWKLYAVNYVCAMWDANKFEHHGTDSVSFGTKYHGAVRAELSSYTSDEPFDIIAIHVRPNDALDGTDDEKLEQKLDDIRKGLDLVRDGIPTIYAGDFNTSHAEDVVLAAGFVRATPNVDTVDKEGNQKVDAVFVTPDLEVRGNSLINGGSITDHSCWVYNGTLFAQDQ